MVTLITGTLIAFLAIMLIMAGLLILAKEKLVSEGDVTLILNGDEANPVVTGQGSTLLTTLADQNIFLPSACGSGRIPSGCTGRGKGKSPKTGRGSSGS